MIAVTLLCAVCGYFAWEAKIARERESLRESIRESNRRYIQHIVAHGEVGDISYLQGWWTGERRYREILLRDDTPDKSVAELRSAMPEVRVTEFRRIFESEVSASRTTSARHP
jgi:hypothetical protein